MKLYDLNKWKVMGKEKLQYSEGVERLFMPGNLRGIKRILLN